MITDEELEAIADTLDERVTQVAIMLEKKIEEANTEAEKDRIREIYKRVIIPRLQNTKYLK